MTYLNVKEKKRQPLKFFHFPDEFVDYIHKIPYNSIVLMSTRGVLTENILNEKAKTAIMTLGSCQIHTLLPGHGLALVGVKGSAPGKAYEKMFIDRHKIDFTCKIPINIQRYATTVHAVSYTVAAIFVDGVLYKTDKEKNECIIAIEIDQNSLEISETKYYKENEVQEFVSFINDLKCGRIVAVSLVGNQNTAQAIRAGEYIGSNKYDGNIENKSWTIIGHKGAGKGSVVETLSEINEEAQSLALLPIDPLYCDGVNIVCSSDKMPNSTFVSIDGIVVSKSALSKGIALVVIEPSTGSYEQSEVFNVHDDKGISTALVGFIQEIPVGKIVAGFLLGNGDFKYFDNNAKKALKQIGSIEISNFEKKKEFDEEISNFSKDSRWAIVGRKGCPPGSLPEIHHKKCVVAVQLTCQFTTSLFSRPFYRLYAKSKVTESCCHASIYMENMPILNTSDTCGLHVAVLDGQSYNLEKKCDFDVNAGEIQSKELVTLINEQPKGSIIVIVANTAASLNLTDSAKDAIESLGSTEVKKLGMGDSYCFMSVKGNKTILAEARSSSSTAQCHMCLPIWGINIDKEYTVLKALSLKDSGKIFVNEKMIRVSENSMKIIVIDPFSWEIDDTLTELESKLYGIPTGKVVIVFLNAKFKKNLIEHLSEQLMCAVESFGSGLVRSIDENSSLLLFGIKGAAPGSVCESIANDSILSMCVCCPKSKDESTIRQGDELKKPSIIDTPCSINTAGKVFSNNFEQSNSVNTTKPRTSTLSELSSTSSRHALLVCITYRKTQPKPIICPFSFDRIKPKLMNKHNFQDCNITQLWDTKGATEMNFPTKTRITTTLRNFATIARNNTRSLFLFYYYGHGTTNAQYPVLLDEETRKENLVFYNEVGDDIELFSDEELQVIFNDFPAECNITCIFHACHSAGMFDVRKNNEPSFIKGVAITSSSACWPTPIYDNNKHDNFTETFQKFLNGHGTYAELYDEVKKADDAAVKHKSMILANKFKSIDDIEIQLGDCTLDSTLRLLQTRIQEWMDAIKNDVGDNNIRIIIELPIVNMQNDVQRVMCKVKRAEDDDAVEQKCMIPVGKYISINDIEIQLDDATLDSTSRLLQTRIQKWMDAIRNDVGDNIRFKIELPKECMQNDVLPVRTFNEILRMIKRLHVNDYTIKFNTEISEWDYTVEKNEKDTLNCKVYKEENMVIVDATFRHPGALDITESMKYFLKKLKNLRTYQGVNVNKMRLHRIEMHYMTNPTIIYSDNIIPETDTFLPSITNPITRNF